ncbi:hypothetical protein CK203_080335 [Vitis vinifera]|uniref:Uncharacterized protein n=1 Tax=Vitis vinifera TaxID=29760 RepID=A0A438CNI9_VITVI|nr:hypothetical protein CK203_080335 [Vitis vinifera]
MKLLSSRPIFLFASYFSSPPPYLFFISHFTTSTTPLSSSYRRHEDESRTVKVSCGGTLRIVISRRVLTSSKLRIALLLQLGLMESRVPFRLRRLVMFRSSRDPIRSFVFYGNQSRSHSYGSFCFSDVLNTIWEYIMGSVNGITNWVLFVF